RPPLDEPTVPARRANIGAGCDTGNACGLREHKRHKGHGLSSILARRWRCCSVGTDSEHQHYQWRMASKRNPPREPMTPGKMRRFGGRVTQAVRLAFTRRAQWSLNRPSTTK